MPASSPAVVGSHAVSHCALAPDPVTGETFSGGLHFHVCWKADFRANCQAVGCTDSQLKMLGLGNTGASASLSQDPSYDREQGPETSNLTWVSPRPC